MHLAKVRDKMKTTLDKFEIKVKKEIIQIYLKLNKYFASFIELEIIILNVLKLKIKSF